MDLTAGTALGPFEIQRVIGAGGMGVVYRAVDSRLGRTVAIKVLPEALRGDADRLRRFEQEARTLGSLNHANLVTLHEVGHHEGMPYLVTELLEGVALRDRIIEGKIPLPEVIRIASAIARGLAAAHGAGITHRDIKPENVFLTSDERVKLLDFGIAKLATTATTEVGMAVTVAETATGSIVGTPGYMAPEQLAGQPVDARTDLFALGVVLYEMLVGTRPFAADTGVEESYGTMKSTARELPATVPAHVARVVRRCLEKRPDARFQSASDLAFALEAGEVAAAPVIAVAPPPRRRFGMGTILGLAVVAAALVLVLIPKPHPVAATTAAVWPTFVEGGPVYHRVTFEPQPQSFARFGADGRTVLWSLRREGKWHVMSSEIATPSMLDLQLEGRLLDVAKSGELALRTAEEGDGGTLVRVRPGAGSPRAVADHVKEAAWGTDDNSFAIVHDVSGPTLEYPVGTTVLHHPHGGFSLVRVARESGRIALCETDAPPDLHGHVLIVDHGTVVATSATYPSIEGLAWSADGREVWFSTDRTVRAIDLAGHERILLRGLLRAELRDVDANGHILLAPTEVRAHTFAGPHDQPPHEVSWFDSSNVFALSADGKSMAFLENTEAQQDADGYAAYVRIGEAKPVEIGHARALTLLPDASAVIAITSPTGLVRVPIGAGTPTNLPRGKLAKLDVSDHPAMSWDGRHVVVHGAEAGDQPMRLWLVDLAGGDPVPVGPPEVRVGLHPISADATQIAIANPAGGIRVLSLTGAPDKLIGKGEEEPVGFSTDGALFVMSLHRLPRTIERYDLASDARTPWQTIAPEGKPKLVHVALDGDGHTVSWSLVTELSDLYVVEPPR